MDDGGITTHRFVSTNGISMHIAELRPSGREVGTVLLLHGFPEIWYSWRHQMSALAKAGFHAVAPDFRGYGLTQNTDPEKNNYTDILEDVVGLLDAIGVDKAFIVAKDWGALIAHYFALLYPERVKAVVTLGITFIIPPLLASILSVIPDGHYLKRWAEPGRAERDFGRFDVATVVKRIYILFCSSKMPLAPPEKETLDLVEPNACLPHWMTEEDLNVYAELYSKSGFEYPMQVPYGSWKRLGSKLSNLEDYTIKVPLLLIAGMKDYSLDITSFQGRLSSMKTYTPELEVVQIEEGNHFMQEQLPDQVNRHILTFFSRPCFQSKCNH